MKTFSPILIVLLVLGGDLSDDVTGESSLSVDDEHTVPPSFFLSKWVSQCALDSPELLYESRIFPSVESFLQEGKIFFGVLMDRLNSSLAGAEKYEDLEKEWRFLVNVVDTSSDLALQRIDLAWYDLIDCSDAIKLPWERRLTLAIIFERFHKILEEYKVLEAVFKAGTKEIISTLHNYLVDVFEKLEENMFYDPKDADRASRGVDIVERMEKSIEKFEPNFIGYLMKKLLKSADHVGEDVLVLLKPQDQVKFFETPQEDIATVMDLYRDGSEQNGTFWRDVTLVFKRIHGSSPASSTEEILQLYANDEELVDVVINLLSLDLQY